MLLTQVSDLTRLDPEPSLPRGSFGLFLERNEHNDQSNVTKLNTS